MNRARLHQLEERDLGVEARHTFTHFHLVLEVWRATVPGDAKPARDGDWRCLGGGR